jgi:hypothetical protein
MKTKYYYTLLISILAVLFFCGSVQADEKAEVQAYVEKFFELVKADDKSKIWDEYAPSSEARKLYTKEEYLKRAEEDDVVLKGYQVVSITISDNMSTSDKPKIEKIAKVVLLVGLAWKGRPQKVQTFQLEAVFLKENGRWWKG